MSSCGFVILSKTDEIEFGYLFDDEVWGKGFDTEKGIECLKYGFVNFGFREIIALSEPNHYASHNVLRKIGFVERGIKNFRDEENLIFLINNIQ